MKTVNSLLIFSVLVLFTLTSCNKDKESPVFSKIAVNGVTVAVDTQGEHLPGSTVDFVVDATDDKELTLYEVRNASSLVKEGTLTGTSASFTYSYGIDSTATPGESYIVSFLVQDASGNSTDGDYRIIVQ